MTAVELLDRVLEQGVARPTTPGPGTSRAVTVNTIEIAVTDRSRDSFMGARWRERVGTTPRPYLLVADDTERAGRVRVLGPSSANAAIRSVDAALLADSIISVAPLPPLDAVRRMADDLGRIGGDGLTFNGVLTRHTLVHRFQADPLRWATASSLTRKLGSTDDWRGLLTKLDYSLQRLPLRRIPGTSRGKAHRDGPPEADRPRLRPA